MADENNPDVNKDAFADVQKVKVQEAVVTDLDPSRSPGNSPIPPHSIVINQDGEPVMTPVEAKLPLDLDTRNQ